MGKEPLVVCVCLTKDRPEMLHRAMLCFRAQTYRQKKMLIWDSTTDLRCCDQLECEGVTHIPAEPAVIGTLRNSANWFWKHGDIIAHFDDDDWSHPERLTEQVALLQASGKEAVGYREMLFWRECYNCLGHKEAHDECHVCHDKGNYEAWLYSHGNPKYCLGTSLMYWRRVWERRPFEDLAHGEDHAWLNGVDSLGVVSREAGGERGIPRMIATIHGGNTSPAYRYLEACEAQGEKWKRVPQWDEYCRRTLEVK